MISPSAYIKNEFFFFGGGDQIFFKFEKGGVY